MGSTKKAVSQPGVRRPPELLALDFGTTGIKAVRLKKQKSGVALAAADILPLPEPGSASRPAIPKPLAADYVALCATVEQSVHRVFTQPAADNLNIEAAVRTGLSVGDEYRTGGLLLSNNRAKKENTLLGVAVPEKAIRHYLDLFADGAPAPCSFELAGLAFISAFLFNCGEQSQGKTVCLLESGASGTYAAFLHANQLQIASRIEVGGDALQLQVQNALGVDFETAGTILADGSVDVAQPVRQLLMPQLRQLAIYREFVERQTRSPLAAIYLSGGQADSTHWRSAVNEMFGMVPQVWSPFEKLEILSGSWPEYLTGHEPRFAAAVGAALSGLEAI